MLPHHSIGGFDKLIYDKCGYYLTLMLGNMYPVYALRKQSYAESMRGPFQGSIIDNKNGKWSKM